MLRPVLPIVQGFFYFGYANLNDSASFLLNSNLHDINLKHMQTQKQQYITYIYLQLEFSTTDKESAVIPYLPVSASFLQVFQVDLPKKPTKNF